MKKYAEKPGFYYLDLKTNMVFSQDLENSKNEKKEVNIKMLVFEETQEINLQAADLYQSFIKRLDQSDYVGLMEVKNADENVEIMVKKEEGFVSEFIITLHEDHEATIIAATGNFDLKDLAKLKDFQNCKGLQVLGKICEE